MSCITVLPAFRRGGVTGELLLAAVNHATACGARRIEAYPTDLVAKGGKLGSGQSNGVLSTFLARGFEIVAPTASGKVLVSLPPPTDIPADNTHLDQGFLCTTLKTRSCGGTDIRRSSLDCPFDRIR